MASRHSPAWLACTGKNRTETKDTIVGYVLRHMCHSPAWLTCTGKHQLDMCCWGRNSLLFRRHHFVLFPDAHPQSVPAEEATQRSQPYLKLVNCQSKQPLWLISPSYDVDKLPCSILFMFRSYLSIKLLYFVSSTMLFHFGKNNRCSTRQVELQGTSSSVEALLWCEGWQTPIPPEQRSWFLVLL